jgi:hypothetical protein
MEREGEKRPLEESTHENPAKKIYQKKVTESKEEDLVSSETILLKLKKWEKLNPPVEVKKLETKYGTFNLVDDSVLPGGTKQRAIVPFLELFLRPDTKNVAIVTTGQGYAQIAAAVGCKEAGYGCHVFLSESLNERGDTFEEPLTAEAKKYGAQIHFVKLEGKKLATIKDVKQAANDFVSKEPNTELIPFGLLHPLFIKVLSQAISLHFPDKETYPKHLWLVVGSGAIFQSLNKGFPNCKYHAVRVGKQIDWILTSNAKEYDATKYERFWEPAEYLPPYDSVARYDAKLWRFVRKYGRTGDFIWNVGRDPK